jgi:putative ABC transport system permease protein
MRAMPQPASIERLWSWGEAAPRELRYAWRGLRRTPVFGASVVAILALVIGANTAVFGVLYALLLRPLPYRDASRLFVIDAERHYAQALKPVPALFGLGDVSDWRSRMHRVESMAGFVVDPVVLAETPGSRVITAAFVSDGFFSTAGGTMAAGRPLGAADRQTAASVISERLAQQLFGGAGRAIGSQVQLSAHRYDIVGVARGTFALPAPDVDVWLGAEFAQTVRPREGFRVLGRARSDHDVALVQADVDQAIASLAASNATAFGNRLRATVVPLRERIVGDVSGTLTALGVAAALLLAVACTNVASLLVARNAALARERCIQLALGASTARLLLRALMDAGILAVAGAGAGLMVGAGLITALIWFEPSGWPLLATIRVDAPVWLFTGALCVLTTLTLGLLPAVPSRRRDALNTASVRGTTPATRRLGRLLSVAQFAVATVLLIGAALLGHSVMALSRADLGVRTEHVAAVSLRRLEGQPRHDADSIAFAERATARIGALPGVLAVGVASSVPPNSQGLTLTLKRQGDSVDYAATGVVATPGYFDALRVRLLDGRFFTDADNDASPPVIIVSQPTARRLFGTDKAIGRTVGIPTLRDGTQGSAEMTVVGVIAPVKYSGIAEQADEQVYRPFAQQPWPAVSVVARTDRDLPGFSRALRSELAALDPALAVVSMRTLDAAVAEEMATPRLRSTLVGAIAVLGLALAAAGLYGVVAYSVSQRGSEMAVRCALGAGHWDVMGLVLREGMVLAFAGIVIGVSGAVALTRWLGAFVYGIEALDPASFAIATGFLLLVALLATYVPARRAARIQPMDVLRTT